MEALPYNHGTIPRETYRGRTDCSVLLHTSFCSTLSLVGDLWLFCLSLSYANSTCSGECAGHFRQILAKFPPQVSSRNAAAAWGCHVHNEVNHSLNKKTFDCANIGDFYDCGCVEDDAKGDEKKAADASSVGEGGGEELMLIKEG